MSSYNHMGLAPIRRSDPGDESIIGRGNSTVALGAAAARQYISLQSGQTGRHSESAPVWHQADELLRDGELLHKGTVIT
jgi:hypothetical protein